MSKFVSKENLEYIIPKLAKAEDIPAIKLTSMDSSNPIILRNLDSNVYVLHGYILPYQGSSDLYAAQTPIQAGVAKSSDASFVQLFFPYNNMLQYFEITDSSYTENTVNLNEVAKVSDIPTVNNAKLTVQKNGTSVGTFTANQSTNATINISVPTGAAADKGVVTTVDTSANLPTSNAVKTFVEGKGYVTSSGSVATATNATKLNNQDASYYLNYNNLSNKPSIPTTYIKSASQSTITADQFIDVNGDRTTTTLTDASGGTKSIISWTYGNVIGDPSNITTGGKAGLMSASDKNKLDSIDTSNFLPKTGGTLTGHLYGQYLSGTWLQTTSTTDLGSTPTQIAVLSNGWVYYRTLSEMKTDLGLGTQATFSLSGTTLTITPK